MFKYRVPAFWVVYLDELWFLWFWWMDEMWFWVALFFRFMCLCLVEQVENYCVLYFRILNFAILFDALDWLGFLGRKKKAILVPWWFSEFEFGKDYYYCINLIVIFCFKIALKLPFTSTKLRSYGNLSRPNWGFVLLHWLEERWSLFFLKLFLFFLRVVPQKGVSFE